MVKKFKRRGAQKTASRSSRLFQRGLVILVIAVGIVGAFLSQRNLPCQEFYRQDAVVSSISSDIPVEVAKTLPDQAKGLAGRACIGDKQGLLFVYDKLGDYKFWMKGLRFPIDIIWIGADKKVVTVKSRLKPSTYPKTFGPSAPAQYVLELKAGEAERLGIIPGATLIF